MDFQQIRDFVNPAVAQATGIEPVENLSMPVPVAYVPAEIVIDGVLSPTSENPVQNKVVTVAIQQLDGRITAIEGQFSEGVTEAVNNWLAAHPEATTTVQNGSITINKFADLLKRNIEAVYNTVFDMVTDENLISGMTVKTLGFYSVNDGGGSLYIVDTLRTGEIADEASVITLENGLVSRIIQKSDIVNLKTFGAKTDDNTFDNSLILQKALTYIYSLFPCSNITGGHQKGGVTIFIPAGRYYFLTQINLQGYYNLHILGDNRANSEIVCKNTYLFSNSSPDTMGFYAENLTVLTNGLISSIYAWDYTFINCRFFNIQPETSPFAIRLYLSVNVKIIRCLFYNCGQGIYFSGDAGSGASTSVLINNCWFSHNVAGLVVGFSANKIVTLWIENSIFEYNTDGIVLNGNASGESIASLTHLHFEGNTHTVTIQNFSVEVDDLLLPDNATITINSLLPINTVKGNLKERADLYYSNINGGTINIKYNDGKSTDTTYSELIYNKATRLIFERYGDIYFLRCIAATPEDISDFFENCSNYMPDSYCRTAFVDSMGSQPVILSFRKLDIMVIKASPWGQISEYALQGTAIWPVRK